MQAVELICPGLFIIGLGWPIAKRIRRLLSRPKTFTIDLGDNLEELELTKKQSQLRIKELRVTMSEITGAEQDVRARHRAERVRGRRGKGFTNGLISMGNSMAALRADKGLLRGNQLRQQVRAEMNMHQRVVNEIDKIILRDYRGPGAGRGKGKRK